MKIEIFNKPEETEEVLMINCKIEGDGSFVVFACNKNGDLLEDGNILEITDDGFLERRIDCKTLGIQTDGQGRIKERE